MQQAIKPCNEEEMVCVIYSPIAIITQMFYNPTCISSLLQMDSTDAVRKVLNGEKPGSGKPPKPHKDEEKGKDRHSDDKHRRDKENRVSFDNDTGFAGCIGLTLFFYDWNMI